jgi:response regulator receiver domain-containing protein
MPPRSTSPRNVKHCLWLGHAWFHRSWDSSRTNSSPSSKPAASPGSPVRRRLPKPARPLPRESVDVVFSDVRLAAGTVDGFRLGRWVHRHHRGVPVLLTSGYGEAIRAAALARESSFVAKPYRQKSLVSRLCGLLDEARGRTG